MTTCGPSTGFHDEMWFRRQLRIGPGYLSVELPSPRCVMVNHTTADLPSQPGNLLAVGRLNEARLGVIARVVKPGVVRLGDRATSSSCGSGALGRTSR